MEDEGRKKLNNNRHRLNHQHSKGSFFLELLYKQLSETVGYQHELFLMFKTDSGMPFISSPSSFLIHASHSF